MNKYKNPELEQQYFLMFCREWENFLQQRIVNFKAGFNPGQPRVPAGNPDGGQWTDSGGGGGGFGGGSSGQRTTYRNFDNFLKPQQITKPKPANKPRKYPKPEVGKPVKVRDRNRVVRNRANIFIGGFNDEFNQNVIDSHSLNNRISGNNYYFSYDSEKLINLFIFKLPQNSEINLIGHSWGGDTAAAAVIKNPNRINSLITVDPVSTFKPRPDFEKIRSSVSYWVNINAANDSGNSLSNGNFAASILNGKWGNTVKNYPDLFINAPYNHADFDAMLGFIGADLPEKTPSK